MHDQTTRPYPRPRTEFDAFRKHAPAGPRIGVYDRWIATLGNGERYLAALVRMLAERHRVELVVHEPVDLGRLREKLGVDLAGIPQRVVPLDADYRSVQLASADYDVFWNVSQGDVFPALARVNAMTVFSPGPSPAPAPADAEAEPDGPRAVPLSGLHPAEEGLSRFARWTGPEFRMLLTGLPTSGPAAVKLVASGLRLRGAPSAEIALELDGTVLERWRLPNRRFFGITVPLPSPRPERMVLTLTASPYRPAEHGGTDDRELGVAVADVSVLTGGARRTIDWFPDTGPSLRGWTPRRRALWEQSTYDLLLPVSRFDADWTERRWGRRGELLHPPVPVEHLAIGEKRPIIASTAPSQAMVEMFRDAGLAGWELVLAGPADRVLALRTAGLPVRVLPDPSPAVLRNLLAEASIYWDATGLGADEQADPHAFEPFAAGAVEAMGAGCVPVALRRASLPEIVADGRTGLLWDTTDDCVRLTRALAADPVRRARLADAAVSASRSYGETAFRQRLAGIVGRIERLLL